MMCMKQYSQIKLYCKINVSLSDKQNNPLVPAVLQVLCERAGSLAIHQLLQQVKKRYTIPPLDSDAQVAVYKLNWLIMNALYQLQTDFYQQGYYLHISTLDIHLEALSDNANAEVKPSSNEALRDYYLDWRRFSETSKEQVEDLLAGMWRYAISDEKAQNAYTILGLEPHTTIAQVRKRYRHLASRYHPDKGGTAEEFMQVREAYEIIMKMHRVKR